MAELSPSDFDIVHIGDWDVLAESFQPEAERISGSTFLLNGPQAFKFAGEESDGVAYVFNDDTGTVFMLEQLARDADSGSLTDIASFETPNPGAMNEAMKYTTWMLRISHVEADHRTYKRVIGKLLDVATTFHR